MTQNLINFPPALCHFQSSRDPARRPQCPTTIQGNMSSPLIFSLVFRFYPINKESKTGVKSNAAMRATRAQEFLQRSAPIPRPV